MATGNPRNKVALAPGRSLMDWVRLTNSGVDLSGVGGRLRDVSREELARHGKPSDLWMAIRGVVYNVTKYVEYHPGGASELMRGVGADATDLFDQVHRWVNVENMLKKCVVGRYVADQGSSAKTLIKRALGGVRLNGAGKAGNSDSLQVPQLTSLSPPQRPTGYRPVLQVVPPPRGPAGPDFDWFQTPESVHLVTYCRQKGMSEDDVHVRVMGGTRLLCRMFLKDTVFTLHWNLPAAVSPVFRTDVSPAGKVELVLQKQSVGQWANTGEVQAGHRTSVPLKDFSPEYVEYVLVERRPVTHSTRLMVLRPPMGCTSRVPLGFHVYLRRTACGVQLVRPYTPVLEQLDANEEASAAASDLYLMVKVYTDGVLTPVLDALRIGQTLEVSEPTGSYRRSLTEVSHLLMLAAGTGFTPMARLLRRALGQAQPEAPLHLVFFNRQRRDILWEEQLEALQQKEARFHVTHVLSDAGEDWCGRRGRVSAELLEELVPGPEARAGLLVAICGSRQFSAACVSLLAEMGVTAGHMHVFDG